MTADTAWSHHTPKVLTEADLAGLPRAVSEPSELTLILAEHDRDCLYSRTGHIADINTMLINREKLRALVSERDALAGRVAELEANALRYEWLRAQFWKDNTLGVVLRPADNTKLGCFLPFGKLLDDAIDHMSAAAPEQPKNSPAQGKSLLRPAGSKPTMCYCPPGVCQAPKPSWCIGNRECDAALSTTPSREDQMVVVKRNEQGTPTVWCDPEIVDLVAALNAAGIETVASCSGHGQREGIISLKDGRQLVLAASPTAPSTEASEPVLKWCNSCGEGVTTFCRAKTPGAERDCPFFDELGEVARTTPPPAPVLSDAEITQPTQRPDTSGTDPRPPRA